MSDLQEQWAAAIVRQDMVGAFELILGIQTDLSAHDVYAALVSLGPHVEPGAIRALTTHAQMLAAALGEPSADGLAIEPFEPLGRSFEVDAHINEVPETLTQTLDSFSSSTDGANLSDFDRYVAAFTEASPEAGRAWYLRLIAAPGALLPKVAQIPLWMAAVHTARELAQIAKLISATVRLTEPAAS